MIEVFTVRFSDGRLYGETLTEAAAISLAEKIPQAEVVKAVIPQSAFHTNFCRHRVQASVN